MKCEHNDCLTCPYPDCIKGQASEKTSAAKRRYNRKYYEKNSDRFHEKYMERSEGKVKRRYRHKELTNDTET